MSKKPGSNYFEWQSHESILEKTAVCDLAAYLYESEYRKQGFERHRAKARVRSAMARAVKKGQLAIPISSSPKSLDVRNLLLFACVRWPQLQEVIAVIDSAAEVSSAPNMEIKVGVLEVEIDLVPPTYPELLSQYRLLRSKYLKEKSLRAEVERELKEILRRQSQRRIDGGKRYE